MKKNFFKKKLASALALALVVASFSPAGISAQAATSTKVVKQGGGTAPTVLYVGGSKVDYSLSTIKAGVKYTWKSSNTKIATITASTGVVTAKAPGSVTITATATDKKTGKTLNTFKKTLTVNLRATSVEAGDDFTLAPGETKKLTAVKTPSNSTDVINFVSSNKAVATVGLTGGVVTAQGAGEATITVYSKATKSSSNKSTKTKVDTVKVTVATGITAVKQTTTNKLELTFNSDVSKTLKVSDLVIANATTNAVQAIKGLSFSADGKVVTVETYLNFADATDYKVTFAEKSIAFKASVGKVARVDILTKTVDVATASAIKYALYDANDVDVTSVADSYRVELTVDTTEGYTDANKMLTLFKVGATAKVKLVYHTYEYVDFKEVTYVDEDVITAVDPTTVTVGNYEKYTITKSASPDWSKDAVTSIAVGDAGYSIFVKAKDSAGNSVAAADVKYESSNNNVLLVSPSGVLVPVKEGTAYVIATVNKTSWTLPVTVVAKRAATSIAIKDSKYSVSVSNTSQIVDSTSVTAVVYDQYGSEMSLSGVAAAPVAVDGRTYPSVSASGDTVTFTAQGLTKGSYTFTVTLGGKSVPVTVTVLDPDETLASTYKLDVSQTTVDTAITSSTNIADKAVKFTVGEYKGGILYDYVTIGAADVAITAPNGSSVSPVISGTSVVYKTAYVSTSGIVEKVAAGAYKVVVTAAGKTLPGYFTVSDTQAKATAAVDTLVVTNTNVATAIANALTIKDADGNVIPDSAIVTADVKSATVPAITYADTVASGTQVFINNVTVEVTINGYVLHLVVSVGTTITLK